MVAIRAKLGRSTAAGLPGHVDLRVRASKHTMPPPVQDSVTALPSAKTARQPTPALSETPAGRSFHGFQNSRTTSVFSDAGTLVGAGPNIPYSWRRSCV